MCASKRFGKFVVLFLFLLTCLGSSIPVSAEAEEEPEVLTAIASADVFFSGFLIAEGDTLELEESQYYLEDAVSYLIAYNENGGEAASGGDLRLGNGGRSDCGKLYRYCASVH